jgi:hypothetical protein
MTWSANKRSRGEDNNDRSHIYQCNVPNGSGPQPCLSSMDVEKVAKLECPGSPTIYFIKFRTAQSWKAAKDLLNPGYVRGDDSTNLKVTTYYGGSLFKLFEPQQQWQMLIAMLKLVRDGIAEGNHRWYPQLEASAPSAAAASDVSSKFE